MPSLSSSPWNRGAPHNQLAWLISQIRSRISLGIAGRPPQGQDFQRQNALNARRCQRISVSGLMIVMASTAARAKPIEPEERQPVCLGQLHAPGCLAPQNVQLMAQKQDLSLTLASRLGQRNQPLP
jgi:hypothetical protein